MGDIRKNARATIRTFKHICMLPPVHHPEGVLLVLYYLTKLLFTYPNSLMMSLLVLSAQVYKANYQLELSSTSIFLLFK